MIIFESRFLQAKKNQPVKIFLAVIVSYYLILHFISNLFKVPGFKGMTSFICIASITFILLFIDKLTNKYFYLTVLYVLILVIWSSLTQDKSIIKNKWNYSIFILLAGGYLVANGVISSFISRVIFIFIFSVFIYCYFIQTEVPTNGGWLFGMNRNHVSVYLITISSLIYITDYLKNKDRIVIWPVLLTLFLSIKSQSRTGTAIAAMLFITVFVIYSRNHFQKYFAEKLHKDKILKWILLFIVMLVIVLVTFYTFKHSRFSKESIMSASTVERVEFYKHFFEELTFSNAITGFKSEYLTQSGYKHLHNSFLQLWLIAGIAAFPAFIAIAWMIYYYFRKAKFLLIILLLFCLACMSEAIFFFRYPDLILFSLWFIAIGKKIE